MATMNSTNISWNDHTVISYFHCLSRRCAHKSKIGSGSVGISSQSNSQCRVLFGANNSTDKFAGGVVGLSDSAIVEDICQVEEQSRGAKGDCKVFP